MQKYLVRRYGRLGGIASGFVPGPDRRVKAGEIGPLARNPLFEIVNVALISERLRRSAETT